MAQEPIPLLTGAAAQRALVRLVKGRVCGECRHFENEDADGLGNCPARGGFVRCDQQACPFFRDAESQEPNHES